MDGLPETASDLRHAADRIALAKISGHGQRVGYGRAYADVPDERLVAELHAITRDPVLYGLALGAARSELEEWPGVGGRLVRLYELAGADEDVAAASLEWQRAHRR